jgi:hypothetical protein
MVDINIFKSNNHYLIRFYELIHFSKAQVAQLVERNFEGV